MLKKPTLAELGETLHHISQLRRTFGIAPDLPETHAFPYFSDLLGNVRSFAKHTPDGKVYGDSATPAQHVGAVVEELHMQLRHYFQYVEPLCDLPESFTKTYMPALKQSHSLSAQTDEEIRPRRENYALVERAKKDFLKYFEGLNEIQIQLHRRDDYKQILTITLPNEALALPYDKNRDRSRWASSVPLALALWCIQNGRKSLLGSNLSRIIQNAIGTQESITDYMQLIYNRIDEALKSQGADIDDYIGLNHDALRNIIGKEAHHLQVTALCEQLQRGTNSAQRLLNWYAPTTGKTDLRTEQWAARDAAALLNQIATKMYNDSFTARSACGERFSAFLQSEHFHTPFYRQRDRILDVCKNLSALSPPSWEQVKQALKNDTETLALLQDVWLRARALQQLENTGTYDAALEALEPLVPLMRVPHKLPALAAALGLPSIDPGGIKAR